VGEWAQNGHRGLQEARNERRELGGTRTNGAPLSGAVVACVRQSRRTNSFQSFVTSIMKRREASNILRIDRNSLKQRHKGQGGRLGVVAAALHFLRVFLACLPCEGVSNRKNT